MLPCTCALLKILQGSKKRRSFLTTGTDLIFLSLSLYLPKAQTVIAVFSIIGSLLLKLMQLVNCKQQSLGVDNCNHNGKPSTLPPPMLSTFYHYFHILPIPSKYFPLLYVLLLTTLTFFLTVFYQFLLVQLLVLRFCS